MKSLALPYTLTTFAPASESANYTGHGHKLSFPEGRRENTEQTEITEQTEKENFRLFRYFRILKKKSWLKSSSYDRAQYKFSNSF